MQYSWPTEPPFKGSKYCECGGGKGLRCYPIYTDIKNLSLVLSLTSRHDFFIIQISNTLRDGRELAQSHPVNYRQLRCLALSLGLCSALGCTL